MPETIGVKRARTRFCCFCCKSIFKSERATRGGRNFYKFCRSAFVLQSLRKDSWKSCGISKPFFIRSSAPDITDFRCSWLTRVSSVRRSKICATRVCTGCSPFSANRNKHRQFVSQNVGVIKTKEELTSAVILQSLDEKSLVLGFPACNKCTVSDVSKNE